MSLRPKRVDFDAVFEQFRKELETVYRGNGQSSFGDPYQQVYDLCTAHPKPYDDLLFDSIAEFLVRTVKDLALDVLGQNDIVTAYALHWSRYKVASKYCDMICEYLNRLILKKAKYRRNGPAGSYRKQRIKALAFSIWKDHMLDTIKRDHSNALLFRLFDLIRLRRDGGAVSDQAIMTVAQSFVQVNVFSDDPLDLYIKEFETSFLQQTRDYYAAESNSFIATIDISSYMTKINSRLAEESARVAAYCDSTSHGKVMRECELQCIDAHKQNIYSDFEAMIDSERYHDCTLAYDLLCRIPGGIDPLLETFQGYVASVGNGIVTRLAEAVSKDPRPFVEALLDHHTKYTSASNSVFKGDPLFIAALDKGFRIIVNAPVPKTNATIAEIIAKYCDLLLRKSTKSQLSETEIDNLLFRVVGIPFEIITDWTLKSYQLALFNYIDDKDVFQKFYSRMLARRLIFGSSLSDEAEVNMITRLKSVCGFDYTAKLQRMFTDVAVSNDTNKRFLKEVSKGMKTDSGEFNVMVLTSGSWPLTGNAGEFQLPIELASSVKAFTNFYTNHYSGRKLIWLYNLCKADVKVNYADRRYELNVSLHQLTILLLFNAVTSLSYEEIHEKTLLEVAEVERLLKPLLEIRLLNVSGTSQAAIISVNTSFSSKRTKIKVSASVQMDAPQEAAAVNKAVDEDRKFSIEAAIVRIMKSRKKMTHGNLVQEVIDHSKSLFMPSVPIIKKCIERLIEKSYLERSSEDASSYVYI